MLETTNQISTSSSGEETASTDNDDIIYYSKANKKARILNDGTIKVKVVGQGDEKEE